MTDGELTPQTPVLAPVCRILRSPSHESVTTDLSLFSVSSSAASDARRLPNNIRGSSPNPEATSQVRVVTTRPADIPEALWFEEETEVIRSCAALCSAAGLQKSFSTSDISQLPNSPEEDCQHMRNAVSELALNSLQRSGFLLENARLDQTSRSCSTWVAVGDVASQLPSPHGQSNLTTTSSPAFTAADFIRSVNKKVRQNYIKRRLLTTYKALERLSQSEFNLDRLEVTPSTVKASAPPTVRLLQVPPAHKNAMLRVAKQRTASNLPLTIRDVERERGKPLSKYERNMMIFNWLHTLDDSAFVEGVQ